MQTEKGVPLKDHFVASISPSIKPLEISFHTVHAQVSIFVYILKIIVLKILFGMLCLKLLFIFHWLVSYFKAWSSSRGAFLVKLLCELQVRPWRLISVLQCTVIVSLSVEPALTVEQLCMLSP